MPLLGGLCGSVQAIQFSEEGPSVISGAENRMLSKNPIRIDAANQRNARRLDNGSDPFDVTR